MVRSVSGKATVGTIFTTFLLILLGIALTPSIQEQVAGVTGTGGNNLTGAAKAIMLQVPMVWVFTIIGIGAAAVYVQFREMRD